MHRLRAVTPSVLVALCSLSIGAAALAGDLNPPLGPVSPTMKPLTDLEPRTAVNAANTPADADSVFVISQPGSYYLTGNIAVPSGRNGVKIAASNVTLDLNGFLISGAPNSLNGVLVVGSRSAVAVRNGAVDSCAGGGVDLTSCGSALVEGVRVSLGGSPAIGVGDLGRVRDCSTASNAGAAFVFGFGSALERCTAFFAGGDGFQSTSGYASLSACRASACQGAGFSINRGASLDRCVAEYQNSAPGFQVGDESLLESCSARSNNRGIVAGAITTIRNCVVSYSGLAGITVANTCTLVGNESRNNGVAGGSPGFVVTGSGNRLEGNVSANNATGFDVAGTRNILVRNTFRGAGVGFNIAAGNDAAPVITNPGATNYANANPFANLSH